MPDQQPKVYGSPVGYQAPDPARQQRAATPATDAQVKAAYQKYMAQAIRAAHDTFHRQLAAQQKPPRGNSTAARSTKPPAILDREIERQSR